MKKENKKMAQQRRAEERKKQTIKNVIGSICKIGLPILLQILFPHLMTIQQIQQPVKIAAWELQNRLP